MAELDMATNPQFPKPKVLLVDLPDSCTEQLQTAGYSVNAGTFGTQFTVNPSDEFAVIDWSRMSLPNLPEQEVIFIDLTPPESVAMPKPNTSPPYSKEEYWQLLAHGRIDPRPLAMAFAARELNRIIRHQCGLMIVFLKARETVEYRRAGRSDVKNGYGERIPLSNWDFVEETVKLDSHNQFGFEMEIAKKTGDFGSFLRPYLIDSGYEAEITPHYSQRDRWQPLAFNKWDKCVAAAILGDGDDPKLCAILLPQIAKKSQLIEALLRDWLPRFRPELFPHCTQHAWLSDPRYEIPKVTELISQRAELQAETKRHVANIDAQIESERHSQSDWYLLLKGTGRELVLAVIHSLESLGFERVIDVDKEFEDAGGTGNPREDVRVEDKQPSLVIDVKGVNGKPEDHEATQALKHAQMRSRDVNAYCKPLMIINSEKNLPPHERDQQAYRDEIVENAKETHLGLMTTWDLFRLLRNRERLNWSRENVTPVFYRSGRIDPTPENYLFAGTIELVRKKANAFGVIPAVTIKIGDRVSVEVEGMFYEFQVESLMINDVSVTEATPGSKCGIACGELANLFRKKMRVFLVVQTRLGVQESLPASTSPH